MQNIQKLYQDLHEGKISRNQFLFQIRKDSRINSFFTSANSYDETVRILKNRGLLFEIKINENQESKVRFEKILKDGNIFQVVDRDTRGMGMSIGIRGPQDQFSMQIVDKDGKVVKSLGSHTSLDGAKSFSNRFESVNEEIGSNDPETSHEGLDNINEAKNNPKVEKLVNIINDMISKAMDEDGDPIGVIEPGSSWEEPYTYSPIEYKNGTLIITSKSQYKNTPEVDKISSENMMYDGVPTLQLIARMYKKALKKLSKNQKINDQVGENADMESGDRYDSMDEEMGDNQTSQTKFPKNLTIRGKKVKSYTRLGNGKEGGDGSYDVEYEDGTKDNFKVSNDNWDIIRNDSDPSYRLNEAKQPTKGADQVNPYELEKGTYYELDHQKDGAKDTGKAKAKALKNLNKNPKYYSDLFSKDYNDKPSTSDQMQIVKESLKNLIDDILSEN